MVEIWDAYDSQFNKIKNVSLIRGETIPDGMYHLVSEVIVKHNDGTYLLMQRDLKKHFGGMWELTACGSALKDETPMDCARRELKEETGIFSYNLQEIGRIVHDPHRTLYVIYLCIIDSDKNAIILQDGETINYKWIDKTKLLEMGSDVLASTRTLEFVKKFY
jgi:8-oxo-dGTP pyrophosphatase MutT (NUDIX family)